jgi:hypothetical protein
MPPKRKRKRDESDSPSQAPETEGKQKSKKKQKRGKAGVDKSDSSCADHVEAVELAHFDADVVLMGRTAVNNKLDDRDLTPKPQAYFVKAFRLSRARAGLPLLSKAAEKAGTDALVEAAPNREIAAFVRAFASEIESKPPAKRTRNKKFSLGGIKHSSEVLAICKLTRDADACFSSRHLMQEVVCPGAASETVGIRTHLSTLT